jgi:hypothetical protein
MITRQFFAPDPDSLLLDVLTLVSTSILLLLLVGAVTGLGLDVVDLNMTRLLGLVPGDPIVGLFGGLLVTSNEIVFTAGALRLV